MIRESIWPETLIPVRLSVRERDLVVEKAFSDRAVERSLQQATLVGSKVVVHLSLADIDDLHGCVAAEANHCDHRKVQRVLDAFSDRLSELLNRFTDEGRVGQAASPVPRSQPAFTAKQGQYLSFIHWYTKLHRTPPAEADLQRYFKVTPPAVHTMVVTLEREGLIDRTPRQARSIRLRIPASELPDLL